MQQNKLSLCLTLSLTRQWILFTSKNFVNIRTNILTFFEALNAYYSFKENCCVLFFIIKMRNMSYPLRQLIGLIIRPHVVQHQVQNVRIRSLAMERKSHQTGHSDQQPRNLNQLLPGTFYSIRPRMIHQVYTAKEHKKYME